MTDQLDLLALWSVPRSRSTAFERSMYERGDFLVVHEPFSRVCDFGVAEVAERTCRSQDEVMAALIELAADQPVFFKDTTDFRFDRLGAQPEFVMRCRHAAMVRNPRDTVRSHLAVQSDAASDAMGFSNLWDIVSTVTSAGLPIHVVDGDEVVLHAEGEMRRFCDGMGIPFVAEALIFRMEAPASWSTTGRWHEGARNSSALGVTSGGGKELSAELERTVEEYVREQQPYYERIVALRNAGTR